MPGADLDFNISATGQRIVTPGDNTDASGFYAVCVLPNVYDVAYDVLNHRLVLSFDAVADGVTVDDVLVEVLTTVEAPRLATSLLATKAAAARS